jgi:conserved oligomeric Golgi complex subunit 8
MRSDSFPYLSRQLSKLIDHNRNHMFDIITQYSAIFPEDPQDGGQILYSWINYKIGAFLTALEEHLPLVPDCSSIALLLDQCMYFGMSLSRIDVDFRMLLPPIFEKCV